LFFCQPRCAYEPFNISISIHCILIGFFTLSPTALDHQVWRSIFLRLFSDWFTCFGSICGVRGVVQISCSHLVSVSLTMLNQVRNLLLASRTRFTSIQPQIPSRFISSSQFRYANQHIQRRIFFINRDGFTSNSFDPRHNQHRKPNSFLFLLSLFFYLLFDFISCTSFSSLSFFLFF